MKILVGISGGVDSAVSAYLLKQAGHDVVGGFMINYLDESDPGCTTKQDLEEFHKVIKWLDIPYEIRDFREEYEDKILNYIYEGYLAGITPNPDVLCNNLIKFGLFMDEAMRLGFDKVATGHYARIVQQDLDYLLYRGLDDNKDQSYFLSGLTQTQLSKAVFPLGDMTKTQVRKLAHEVGLPNADRPDSQGLCFVGNIPMSQFLIDKIGPKPGSILDKNGNKIGDHKGAYLFTIGQRRGIGLPYQSYVIGIDIKNNTITVGDEDDLTLFRSEIFIPNIHWIGQKPMIGLQGYKCGCKIRYRQSIQEATVFEGGSDGGYKIIFHTPQKGVPDGQVAVLYDGDRVVGSGIISSMPD